MCRTKSGITFEDGLILCRADTDSHDSLRDLATKDGVNHGRVARWEVTPTRVLTDFRPEAWKFAFDDNAQPPSWWKAEHEAAAVREALAAMEKQFDAEAGVFGGHLDLQDTQVKSLGKLASVGGSLYLRGTQVKSLGKLASVGGHLDLQDTQVKSLGKLASVGGSLDLRGTAVKSLGKLASVGLSLDLQGTAVNDWSHVKIGGQVIR